MARPQPTLVHAAMESIEQVVHLLDTIRTTHESMRAGDDATDTQVVISLETIQRWITTLDNAIIVIATSVIQPIGDNHDPVDASISDTHPQSAVDQPQPVGAVR